MFTTQLSKNNKSESVTLYIDVSGSVQNFAAYWEHVEKLIKSYENNNINKIFIWDDVIKEVTLEELYKIIRTRYGRGGTYPYLIADSLKKNQIYSNIVIVTDGDVSNNEVEKTDKLLSSVQLDDVSCHIIGQSSCNLSVTCAFTRNNNSVVYYKTSRTELKTQVYTKPDPKLLETLSTINVDTFLEKYQMLESIIIGRNMGKSGDHEMKEKLMELKKNLSSDLANQSSPGLQLRANLEMNNFDDALLGAKQMNNEYFSLIGMDIDKKVNYLISLCGNMKGMFDVNSIRSNKMATAENVKVEQSSKVDIEIEKLIVNTVECPITMDVDVPQILVNECQPVLANLDKSVTDDIISCPLRILNYPEVVEKLKKSISRWVGTQTDGKLMSNPYTRQNLLGTIPLGSCQQHIDCGNYTISRLFTSGKLLGNLDLYWAVIWYLIKQNTWDFLSDISVQASEHLCYRLKSSTTFASLTGLPQFVITKVPTDVAIWYCVNSVLLDPPTDRDTTRLHVFNIDVMLAILDELKYPVSDKTLKYINRGIFS